MGSIKETVINKVIVEMQQWIETKVLKRLEEAIRSALYGCKVEEESTELSTCMDDNMYILQVFAANKKLEGRKEISIMQYVRHAKNFLENIDKNYRNVTKDDVKVYLARYSQNHKPNTVSNMKQFLSSFFTWLHDEGYIMANPVRSIKGIRPVEVQNKAMTVEEELAVRDAAGKRSTRDRAIIDVLLSTGMRVSEIQRINRTDVDLDDSSITFLGAKNGRYRTVYLDPRARKHLLEYLKERSDACEALFATENKYGEKCGIEPKRMSKEEYEHVAKQTGKSAGIDRACTVHVYRKTFATRLADRECPLQTIQELMGHADAGTTAKNYVAKSKARTKKACEKYLFVA